MKDFTTYHPIVCFIYFVGVIIVSIFTFHPVVIATSLIGAIGLNFMLEKNNSKFKLLFTSILVVSLIALSNPFFSHRGVTVLFFMNDKPITLEAFYYGIGIGFTLVGIFFWFKNYSIIMTSEKFMYLFAKISPQIALLLSTVLRFIPEFKTQLKKISDSQKTIGVFHSNNIFGKIRTGISVFSVMVTWAFENAMQTTDSMRARGYGLGPRSSYSNFKFTNKDAIFISLYLVLLIVSIFGINSNSLEYYYYPRMTHVIFDLTSVVIFLSFGLMVFLPTILQIKEKIKWKYLISQI